MSFIMASSNSGLDRVLYADAIRVFSIIAVIAIHVSSPVVSSIGLIKSFSWWTGNIINSFCRPSIPLFVMISGLLLLDANRNETIASFFSMRIRKVVVPFIVWGIIYLFWIAFVNERHISPCMIIRELIQGPIYNHFWFIYMILGLYLATPILKSFINNTSEAIKKYFIVLWFFVSSVLPLFYNFINLEIGIYFVVTTGFTGYYVLGSYLKKTTYTYKKFIISLIAFTASWIITCIGTLIISDGSHFNDTFYNYLSPNIFLMSMCMFLLFKFVPYQTLYNKFPNIKNMIRRLSDASFAIYLIHIIILETFHYGSIGFSLSGMTIHPLFGIPITTLSVYIISLLIIIIIKRLPLIGIIFP